MFRQESETSPILRAGPWRRVRLGLSGKLLILTVVFVTLAELAIFVPSLANFRLAWLSDRIAAARTAALVLEAAPEAAVPPELARQILDSVGAQLVVVKREDTRRLLAMSDMPPAIDQHVDLRDAPFWRTVPDAFETLFAGRNRTLRVVAAAPRDGDFLEIVLSERPLHDAMVKFAATIFLISFLISASAGLLIYFSLHALFVRPMRRLTERMSAYREAPEDASRILIPSGRDDEIGIAEDALAELQRGLSQTLAQKTHLAALGLAVSKINHDLRNLLASVQLISDRLATIQDPAVQRFAPKLLAALDRAITYCEQTLSYGRAQEPLPERRDVVLAELVEEVRDTLGIPPDGSIGWVATLDRALTVDVDPDQLFRVLLNLSRNAMQALAARAPNAAERDQIRIGARRRGAVVEIEVSDTGPGIPAAHRDQLFSAFRASARRGGTGLGLPIADELVRAHGGEIRLIDGTIGATFLITIPDRPAELRRRGQRARA
ncbi:sensor histidine kinase [Aquabacter spiritensis]|uniref:histidine kinase n=1 Tax=Aquabacter spiritensis TaxID=933073 RepID=A0A4R3MA68_9HYPH|nr:HAMP domain-containing sensor histidine kinase [Aquabacter spiritensis]TCT08295.1 signal transduction histidine kinase /histidine kinase [Aquabacter spiritensis]